MPNITVAGFGTTLAYQVSGSYVTIGNLYSLTPPNPETGSRDVTSLSSTSRQFEPTGLVDYNEVSGSVYASYTAHAALYALLNTTTNMNWLITFPNADTFQFLGHITKWDSQALELENTYSVNFTIKVSLVATWV